MFYICFGKFKTTPSSRSAFGLLNPTFFKSSPAAVKKSEVTVEGNTELVMNDISLNESSNNRLEDIEPMVVEEPNRMEIKNIFSTNVENEKTSKTKKKGSISSD